MQDESPRTAVITGATSGVTRALATLFAQDGHHLVLVGRNDPALREIAETLRARHQIRVTLIDADLFDERGPHEIHEQVRARGIFVSYLVNDAGQGLRGSFADGDLKQELALIQLNVASVVTLTKLFLRDMLERDEGRILQLASTSGHGDTRSSAALGGCRAFLLNYTAAAAAELRDTKVSMTALMPDHVDSADRLAREGYRALMLGTLASSSSPITMPTMPMAVEGVRTAATLPVHDVVAARLRRSNRANTPKAGRTRH